MKATVTTIMILLTVLALVVPQAIAQIEVVNACVDSKTGYVRILVDKDPYCSDKEIPTTLLTGNFSVYFAGPQARSCGPYGSPCSYALTFSVASYCDQGDILIDCESQVKAERVNGTSYRYVNSNKYLIGFNQNYGKWYCTAGTDFYDDSFDDSGYVFAQAVCLDLPPSHQ